MRWLEKEFLDSHMLLYRTTDSVHEPWAAVWPTSQVLDAAIDVARITRKPADLARVRRIIDQLRYYRAPGGMYMARAIRSLRYTDDNNWIGLDLLDAYDLLHNKQYLTNVEQIFAFLVSKWDRKKGGIVWADGQGNHRDHPTVSTAPASTIGFRLAALTHKAYYRTWATRFFNWENAHLRAPNGLYWDNVRANGTRNKDFVAYNQGVMIDADLAYAKLSRNHKYFIAAQKLARATAKALPNPSLARGNLAAYDAIYFQALGHLNATKRGAASLAPVQAFVNAERSIALAPRAAAARDEQGLLEQAAYVIATAVLAG
jgi:predicted alpha-1,6-mannanase (GH76 family)